MAVRQAASPPGGDELASIDTPTPPRNTQEFVFATHAQLEHIGRLPAGLGLSIWLMRGCGLRISEALAVRYDGFRDKSGRTLRVTEQVTTTGSGTAPLKHRHAGEYRDIPVPTWVWAKVQQHAAQHGTDGYLFPAAGPSRLSRMTATACRFSGPRPV